MALIVLAFHATAQQVPQQEAKGATIHGFLFDALTGSKASAGSVLLQDTQRRTIKQVFAPAGEYRITDIPQGEYFLHIDGTFTYVAQDYGEFTPGGPPRVLIIGNGTSLELSITLQRAGTISGRLSAPDGSPVSNGQVDLLVVRYDSVGHRYLAPSGNVGPTRIAAGTGNFFITGVPPGEYYIRAAVTLSAVRNSAPSPLHYNVRTYYPGVKDPEGAVIVEMPKATRTITGVNLSFKDVSEFKVSGRIAFPRQERGSGALSMYLVPRDNAFAQLIDPPPPLIDFDAAEEAFELRNVQPGSYDLYIASITDYSPIANGSPSSPGYNARVPVEVRDRDVTGLLAELEPGVDVRGEFKLDGSFDPTKTSFAGALPVFIPQDGKPWALAPAVSANPKTFVKDDGSFELIHAAIGQYRIGAVLPETLYVSNASLGARNIMGQTFEIDRRTDGPLILDLKSDGAKFEGTVTDIDNAPANAMVVLVPPTEFRGDPGTSKFTRTDNDGHFMIMGIRPGIYTVYAFPRIDNNAWLNEEFMNTYRALGLQMNFGRGTLVHRDLKSVLMPR
jgi:hypothetical protein